MPDKEITFKEIFLTVGNSLLTAGVAALSTTSLPAVLPSVFVGAFCFQSLQHLWQKRKEGLQIDVNDLANQTDALQETMKELKIYTEDNFNQIANGLKWLCIGINDLGDRVKTLEEEMLGQSGEMAKSLVITGKHQKAIEEIFEKINNMNAPQEVKKAFNTYIKSLTKQNLPYPSIGNLFKGRDQALSELHNNLRNHKAAAITQVQAISGLGGIGKTRLAVEYAWQYCKHYSALLFARADSPEALKANLASLTGANILNLPEREATQEDVQIAAVINWLRSNLNWLLIIDNADTERAAESVEGLIPHLTGGHIIVTSRISNWSGSITSTPLDKIDIESAREFLLERTKNNRHKKENDIQLAEQLAKKVDCLLLALEQTAAYIK